MSTTLEACKSILNKRYRWIGIAILVVWSLLMPLMVGYMGIGLYFAVYCSILLINAFFTIDTCMQPENIAFGLVPYLVPIAGFIIIVIMGSPNGLQLLTGMSPALAEQAGADINFILGQGFTQVVTTPGASPGTWFAFLPLYIIGFAVYIWADGSEQGGIKGIATLVIFVPIMVQIVVGLTTGTSIGLLGAVGDIGGLLVYLGDLAKPLIVFIGSILDFILVAIFLSVEHIIVEPEESPE